MTGVSDQMGAGGIDFPDEEFSLHNPRIRYIYSRWVILADREHSALRRAYGMEQVEVENLEARLVCCLDSPAT